MSKESHLLLVATTTGYQARMFANSASRLGIRCTLATDRCAHLDDPWGGNALALRFEDTPGSLHILLEAHHERGPFDGVAALGDRTTMLAALFADRVGLAFHSPDAVEAARNKFFAKERFRGAGLRVPWYKSYPLDADAAGPAEEAPYPCVLKPLGLSGSRGVIRANNSAEFVQAYQRIRQLLGDPEIRRQGEEQNRFLQVEAFIPGAEFALEGVMTNGELRVLALFDKPDPLDGPYFEETIYVTPSRQPEAAQQDMIRTIQGGVQALGLTHGPVHAEVRYNRDGAWILEIAGRPIGGYCAKALRFEGGIALEELLLRHALGEDPRSFPLAPGATGVMMIPIPKAGIYRGVEGVEDARRVEGIEDVLISAVPGQKLHVYPESSSYLGFIFSRAPEPAQVEASLRAAHERLRFEIMHFLK